MYMPEEVYMPPKGCILRFQCSHLRVVKYEDNLYELCFRTNIKLEEKYLFYFFSPWETVIRLR